MEMTILMTSLIIVVLIFAFLQHRLTITNRHEFIQKYRFPRKVRAAVIEQYPHLNEQQVAQVIQGLRDYFHICNAAKRNFVSMPSEVVDTAWHQFILFTHDYQHFCKRAFGRFLHHTPAEGTGNPTQVRNGIQTAWRLSCARENINHSAAQKLPLIFALDAMLNIENGFVYALDCESTSTINGQATQCVTDLRSNPAAGCGGAGYGGDTNVNADGGTTSSCGAGCGGGCGS